MGLGGLFLALGAALLVLSLVLSVLGVAAAGKISYYGLSTPVDWITLGIKLALLGGVFAPTGGATLAYAWGYQDGMRMTPFAPYTTPERSMTGGAANRDDWPDLQGPSTRLIREPD
jgi:hypothetical protein